MVCRWSASPGKAALTGAELSLPGLTLNPVHEPRTTAESADAMKAGLDGITLIEGVDGRWFLLPGFSSVWNGLESTV